MKYAIRFFTILLFLGGFIGLFYLSTENKRLGEELNRLENELGKMSIQDLDRVHFVEIKSPSVPPEVASHVQGIWQFRCYLPPGYNGIRLSGGGRVSKDGIYHIGGYSSSRGSPNKEAIHEILTLSLQKRNDSIQAFYSFGGSSGTTSWGRFIPDHFDNLTVQKLVRSDRGPRSFDQDTILPLLKVYDPNTAENKVVAGNSITTYSGGIILICPTSREQEMNQLRNGVTPNDFKTDWLASEASDE